MGGLLNIIIIGLNHQIQRSEILSGGDEIVELEQTQKQHFANALARWIEEREVGFIGEEAEHGMELIARKVAQQLNLHSSQCG